MCHSSSSCMCAPARLCSALDPSNLPTTSYTLLSSCFCTASMYKRAPVEQQPSRVLLGAALGALREPASASKLDVRAGASEPARKERMSQGLYCTSSQTLCLLAGLCAVEQTALLSAQFL